MTLLGMFYVGWLFSYVLLLRLLIHGPEYVFYLFGVVWLGCSCSHIWQAVWAP